MLSRKYKGKYVACGIPKKIIEVSDVEHGRLCGKIVHGVKLDKDGFLVGDHLILNLHDVRVALTDATLVTWKDTATPVQKTGSSVLTPAADSAVFKAKGGSYCYAMKKPTAIEERDSLIRKAKREALETVGPRTRRRLHSPNL